MPSSNTTPQRNGLRLRVSPLRLASSGRRGAQHHYTRSEAYYKSNLTFCGSSYAINDLLRGILLTLCAVSRLASALAHTSRNLLSLQLVS